MNIEYIATTSLLNHSKVDFVYVLVYLSELKDFKRPQTLQKISNTSNTSKDLMYLKRLQKTSNDHKRPPKDILKRLDT